jgi:hypothetical protein
MTESDHNPQDLRDELPEDLVAVGYIGAYEFPDNSRRRTQGVMYLLAGIGCAGLWVGARDSSALVNQGMLWAALALCTFGLIAITSGWKMRINEKDALVAAQQAVGFAVGHASAQQVWHGIRSRPTWRVLCYSAEEPPRQRGLVLVDAIDGHVVEELVEANPEQWTGQ